MKNILLLIKVSFNRSKSAIIFAFIGAAVLCMLMNLMSNLSSDNDSSLANIKVGMIDNDNSSLSADLKDYMINKLNLDIEENFSYDELATMLIDRDISAIIEVPDNYNQSAIDGNLSRLEITTLEDYVNAAFIKAYLNTYMNSIQTISASAGGDAGLFEALNEELKSADIKIINSDILNYTSKEESYRKGFINACGFFLMFVFGFGLILALMIFEDKASGTFQRIQAAPVRPVHYIIGITAFGILSGLLMVAFFNIYIKIKDISIGVPLYTIILIMSLFTVLTIGISLMAALFIKSRNAVATLISGWMILASILGGAYFPIDTAPDSLQKLARITPNFWFMDAVRRLMEKPEANITPNIIVLILFTVLVYLISAFKFTQRKSSN